MVAAHFPGALVPDRTAIEGKLAEDGSVCLVADRIRAEKTRDVKLPGIALRPRKGAGPLASDRPFMEGMFLSSSARAYLDNLRPSRARGAATPRTLTRAPRSRMS